MDTRYVVSALIGAFCLFALFAAITTARHLSQREGASAGTVRTKQSRQEETDRLNGFAAMGPDLGKMSGTAPIARADEFGTKLTN
jgi:hypothetical protein